MLLGDSVKEKVYFSGSTAYYGEYKCRGTGAIASRRVQWAKHLTTEEAAPFMTKDMIGGKAWIRPVPTTFRRFTTTVP